MVKSHIIFSSRRTRILQIRMILITSFIVLILSGLIYVIINKYFWHTALGPVPFIAADHIHPIKVKPDSSLNPRLPHTDKLIYNELDNQSVISSLESNILELPEQPDIHEDESISPFLENDEINNIASGSE